MLNRFRWIAVSYLTRRAAVVGALAMLIPCGLILWSEQNWTSYGTDYPKVNLTKFPHTILTQADFPHVEGWSLTIPPNSLENLSFFPEIRRLEINARAGRHYEPERLAVLSKLELLVWHGTFFDDSMIRGFARLPKLTTLVIDDQSESPGQWKISEEGVAALARAPALKTLYIGSLHAPTDRSYENLARRILPKIDVRRAYRFKLFSEECIPFALFAVFVGFQLSRQFSNPLCRVAPGYAVSHAIVGLGLTLLAVVLSAANLLRFVSDPFLAIAFSAAIVATAVGIFSTSSLNATFRLVANDRQFRSLRRVVYINGGALGLFVSVLPNPFWTQWILDERRAAIPWAFAATAIVSAAYAIWSLSHLIEWSAGGSVPTTGDGSSRQKNLWNSMNAGGTWLFPTNTRERKIEGWQRHSPEWTWWARVARWRTGNPPAGLAIMLFPLIISLIAIVVIANAALLRGIVAMPLLIPVMRVLAMTTATAMAFVFALRVATIWRGRLGILPRELLLPVSARELKREWIAAFLCDLLPAAFFAAVLIAIAAPFDKTGKLDWLSIPWNFLVGFVATYTLTAAVASAVVVERRGWLALVLVPLSVLVLGLIVSLTKLVILTVIAVAAAVCSLTAFRWLRTEAA